MATTPSKQTPAVKTALSDVRATFNRYYGRTPKESDMATINWLTQFSPVQVEQKLAKTSPITKGKLWHEYQQQRPQTNELHSFIDASSHTDAEKTLLKFIADNDQYTSGNAIKSDAEWAKILEDVAKQAELDIGAYYDKVKYEDLEDLKTQMADIRSAAARYNQAEQLNYKQRLRSAKESLAARGKSFSGTARTQIGDESVIGGAGIEGEMPMERRYGYEENLDKIQRASRDAGLAAERKYGSSALGAVQNEFGSYASPYDLRSGNVTYQQGRYAPLYEVKRIEGGVPQEGYVRSGNQTEYATGANRRFASTYDLERQAAIEREKQRRMATLGYMP